jgi:hypothetical protein
MSQLNGMGALGVGFAATIISILLALPVTILLTLAVIRRFRKRVAYSMQTTGGALDRADLIEEPAFSATLGELKIKQIDVTNGLNHRPRAVSLVRVARQRERQLATIFGMAACAHPLILAAIMTFSTYKPHAQRHVVTFVLLYTFFFFITGTPVALAATMILTKQLRFLIVAVLALMTAFWGLGVLRGADALGLWLMIAGLPTGVVLLLNTRRLRAVGPIIFTALLFLFCAIVAGQAYGALSLWDVIGPVHFVREDLARLPFLTAVQQYLAEASNVPQTIGVILSHPLRIIRPDHPERLTAGYKLVFGSISVITIVIGATTGWMFIRWLAVRYRNRRASDQMLTIDVLMAIFTVSAFLVFYMTFSLTAAICTLTGFAGYKLFTHWQLRRRMDFPTTERALTLLLLRVFRSDRHARTLLEKVMQRWRYLGPIRLITGTDFADSTIEPHEFFEFLSGRLSRAFVKDREDLGHRLSEYIPRPDPDGRYRIEDFFCHLDTWQMTVAHLAKEADVVLMDLRGFSSAHRGCTLEIAMLVNSVPVNRLVFVADTSTNREYLTETLQRAWSALPSTSPNMGMGKHEVCLVQAKGHLRTAETLLGLLCEKVMT